MKFLPLIILLLTGRFLGAATFEVSEALMAFTALATPGALKISGKQNDPKAMKTEIKIHGQQMSGTASLQLVSLATGIDLRDKHMKEKYLETDKFPQAIFTFKKVTLPKELTGGHNESSWCGKTHLWRDHIRKKGICTNDNSRVQN